MEWSKYQTGIFDFVKGGQGHGAGIAVAGAGKTTVAVESMKFVPKIMDVLFTTFGKLIAADLSKRVKGLSNCSVGTYNALGFRACLNGMNPVPELDEDKTEHILWYDVFNQPPEGSDDYKRFNRVKNLIIRIVSLLKGYPCLTGDDVVQVYPDIIADHEIEVPNDPWFFDMVMDVYGRSLALKTYIDYDDQKLFPLVLDIPLPQFDFIIIDEFQDTNGVEQDLMDACAGTNTRFLIIGDPDQSIYSFRGAIPGTMGTWTQAMNAKELPLSLCYRCSKAAVLEAKKIVPRIESWEMAAEGCVDTIKKPKYREMLKDGDMVLCRTTAPLVGYCLTEVENGRKAFVKGREFGTGLQGLINQYKTSDTEGIQTFNDRLQAKARELYASYNKLRQNRKVIALQDKVSSISRLAVGCQTVEDLDTRIKDVFKDQGEGIQFMTAHKSKGLEAGKDNDVFIIRPDLMPHMNGDPDEEKRIKYVATTRTQRGLFYVEKDPSER